MNTTDSSTKPTVEKEGLAFFKIRTTFWDCLWNHLIIFISCSSILGLILVGVCLESSLASVGVLAITAIVILWYTWETSQIRKAEKTISEASEEALLRTHRPSVGCNFIADPEVPHETNIIIKNLSAYAVAVRINCNFRINKKPIQAFTPDLEGNKYWNLQFNGTKQGHFSWVDLFLLEGLISQKASEKIKKAVRRNIIIDEIDDYRAVELDYSEYPEITSDLEVYCENEYGFSLYYPAVHYKYDFKRWIWIPTITSDEPYWQQDKSPSWINDRDG